VIETLVIAFEARGNARGNWEFNFEFVAAHRLYSILFSDGATPNGSARSPLPRRLLRLKGGEFQDWRDWGEFREEKMPNK
jgi:hypothetical protein